MAVRSSKKADKPAKKDKKAAKPEKEVKKTAKKTAPAKSDKKVPAKKAARKPAKKITYKAPADLRSHFVEVQFAIAKDGLISSDGLSIEAIKGSLTNEKAPRYDLLQFDPVTAAALITRLQYRLFATNPTKRLTPGLEFTVIVRCSVSKDHLIRAGVKTVYMVNEKGKEVELTSDLKDKTDIRCIARRKIRSCNRFLAGAFQNMLSMDELKQLKKDADALEAAEEDDGDSED